jgi:hypothetical protein
MNLPPTEASRIKRHLDRLQPVVGVLSWRSQAIAKVMSGRRGIMRIAIFTLPQFAIDSISMFLNMNNSWHGCCFYIHVDWREGIVLWA